MMFHFHHPFYPETSPVLVKQLMGTAKKWTKRMELRDGEALAL